jgi:site-specific DNA-cytosine methylase
MRCLEVFCGTKSVSKALGEGWETVSVDLSPAFNPTILADVATWDFTVFPRGHFHYIHLSPPCTEFSRALTSRPRRLEEGDVLAERSLAILEHFRPRWWTLENPVGLLQTRPYMQPLLPLRRLVCYCKYNEGAHRYRKQTAIWTNLRWSPRPMCTKATPCLDKQAHGKHLHHAQQGAEDPARRKTRAQLYSLPPALPREWNAAMRDAGGQSDAFASAE